MHYVYLLKLIFLKHVKIGCLKSFQCVFAKDTDKIALQI